jgi:hypothetical protein
MKVCSRCHQKKKNSEFGKHSQKKDGLNSWCKECNKKIKKEDYEKNRDKILDAQALKLPRNPKYGRAYHLKRTFGISEEQFESLLSQQNGRCAVCGKLEIESSKRFSVDHAHGGPHRGRIRAIVCDLCNRFVLWKHETGEKLRKAAEIVDNPLTDWYVPEKFVKPKQTYRRRKKKINNL